MKLYITTLLLMLGSSLAAHAQDYIQVTGTVTDGINNTLTGVSVTIKNQVGGGAMTNDKGRYTVRTEPYSTLIFSHIGFATQEIKLGNKGLLNVTLTVARLKRPVAGDRYRCGASEKTYGYRSCFCYQR
ncbi:carboxypeptidase-like regulatory domain-containing protein [Niastella sp. OAS944]|uniref:carboxypeptidase-like regulatory domain-containing protein n=1 Tax=Niastella sp. OAS944 TaxID=2664089 RepID=UPI0034811890